MPICKNLKKWLSTNKMWINSRSDKEKTHNVMEYGCFLSIREDLADEFKKKLAQTLTDGKINFLLEIRTDYFKFMVDVDFKSEFGLTSDEKQQLLILIQEAVTQFIGDQIKNNYVIISSCNDETIKVDDEQMIKIGFHLIWPKLDVSVVEARYLRSAIIQYLTNSDIKFLSLSDWEEIIDDSIYDEKHALRMNGSNKNIKCKTCKCKKSLRGQCMDCNTTGWIDAGRVYKPYLIINEDLSYNETLLQKLQNDYYKNLKFTSIRTNKHSSNINIDNLPNWFSKNKYEAHINSRKTKKKKTIKIHKSKNPLQSNDQEEIPENNIKFIELKKYLESELFKLSPYFRDIELDKLKKIKFRKNFIYVFTTKSHFCLNMNREHSSNHIYFVINQKSKEVYQKCPSPWKNKQDINCCDFKSKSLILPNDLYKLLFDINEENLKKPKTKQLQKKQNPRQLLYLSLDD